MISANTLPQSAQHNYYYQCDVHQMHQNWFYFHPSTCHMTYPSHSTQVYPYFSVPICRWIIQNYYPIMFVRLNSMLPLLLSYDSGSFFTGQKSLIHHTLTSHLLVFSVYSFSRVCIEELISFSFQLYALSLGTCAFEKQSS